VGVAVPFGSSPLDSLFDATKRVLSSRLDLMDKHEEEIGILEDYVKLAHINQDIAKARLDSGKDDIATFARFRYHRADADIQLLKAKRKVKEPPKTDKKEKASKDQPSSGPDKESPDVAGIEDEYPSLFRVKDAKPPAGDDELRKLLLERFNAAKVDLA